ncbi:hypothetical protein PMA3_20620 [Pseudomonas silesiensis]|uniref:Uncharacterized protein n=1 Tax=Pseudomonas silesiensis TaxID=1853130 RepID=A0A191YXG4_9PSED|nr:hypothetical protein [Pseudomonas silesiensis]ANJ57431.1 hypothetical protein PMA3_20620 [Pseudomonas silesiensis]
MTYKLIDIGKLPDEPFNYRLMLPLPASTPFGNFQLKWMDMMSRLNEVNRQIIISHETWEATIQGDIEDSMKDVFNTHRFSTEYAVTGMRRVADELVGLVWCLERLEVTGEYPKKIKMDSIGEVKESYNGPNGLIKSHHGLIKLLNDLSNTFKHSFIQSDLARVGQDEPLVLALNLKGADHRNEPTFYTVRMSELVHHYTQFFHDCREWLDQHCKTRNQQHQ